MLAGLAISILLWLWICWLNNIELGLVEYIIAIIAMAALIGIAAKEREDE